MPRTVYALLVGIDAYPLPLNPLRGCVNDIRHVETLLQERMCRDGDQIDLRILTNGAATRQGIIDGFRQHLGKAKGNDVALFYYSGHGSQEPSPREFWHLEPDRLDETLVCYDSRLPGNWDLADKELAQLIAEVAENNPHIAVILDCCHSGSGTRALSDDEMRVRRIPTDARVRPLDTFIVTPAQAANLSPTGHAAQGSGWYSLPKGRHVMIAACSPEEEAKELRLGGEPRGAFSYYLLDTLQRGSDTLIYRDLFKRVNALVRAKVSTQSPQMEATHTPDLDQPFLGGAIATRPVYFTISHDRQRGWVIDGGAVHGVPVPTGDETTSLALFEFDANVDDVTDLTSAIGEARVQQVFPAQSAVDVTLTSGAAPDLDTTYKALVTGLPLPPLVVAFEGNHTGLDLVRRALAASGPHGKASLLVREGSPEEAELLVRAETDCYRIRRKGDGYTLVVDTPGFHADSATLVVQRMEHMARWRHIVELSNPTSRIATQDIRLDILRPDQDGEWQPVEAGFTVRLDYAFQDGEWQQPQFKLKLTNTSSRRLYCMLIDLPETYGAFPMLAGAGVWLDPGQDVWANDGEPIYASVLDDLWRQGVIEFQDILKLIVSTEESDATLLTQDDLPVTVRRSLDRGQRAIARMHTLNRLMHRVPTRHFSSQPERAEAFADWTTAEVSFTTVRPLEAADIAKPEQRIRLGHGVTVMGHAGLQARARLTSLPQVGRDAGNLALPALLRDHPDVVQPFEFSTSRSGEPGLSVLELVDVENHTAVTPDEPLVIRIDAALHSEDSLFPVGYDGEFFLPLGRVQRTADGLQVILERLPAPTSAGVRDLKGSIRILFQKLVGQRLGWTYDYPQLAVAVVDPTGQVTYTKDTQAVQAAVKQANRILLYVHGIIGDTRGMAASAWTDWLKLPNPVPGIGDRYDLMLTFDYENLHTSIDENARLLKTRLQEVGLSSNHGKTLHVVAHSMGGLVSRWFIEHESGNQVTQHLVMLGTPNAGSPWSTVQDWATTAIGIGLNALSGMAWPAQALSILVRTLEKVDVSLDQMQPGSELLRALAASPDPGIPYTIIAGNTSMVSEALITNQGQPNSLFERLWAKIKPRHWLYTVTAPVFFGQPNDIAVSVESIKNMPDNHKQQMTEVETGCDHLTYFSTEAGLNALMQSLV